MMLHHQTLKRQMRQFSHLAPQGTRKMVTAIPWEAPGSKVGGSANYRWTDPEPLDKVQYEPEDVFLAGMRQHHTANTAYPIGHLTTLKPYRVKRLREQQEILEVLQGSYESLDEMMLYAHVPFCHTRCQFCEYTVVDPLKGGRESDIHEQYFEALGKELELYKDVLSLPSKKLVGFDIGGGTPSFVEAKHITKLLDQIDAIMPISDDMDISIETTPKIAAAEPEKIKAYYAAGIRRISMGVQTTDFRMAKELGRDDQGYIEKAVENIRNAGFESFNIDLMYGFPIRKGGRDRWAETVENTIRLKPEHVTLYRMRYKGTRMAHLQDRVTLDQVNAQGEQAVDLLSEAGYTGWTGKNTYSNIPHNSGCSDYLHKRVVDAVPYIGLGLGAQSYSHHSLTYNLGGVTKALQQYLKSVELGRLPTQDVYHLSRSCAMGKMTSVSFYFGGIDNGAFRNAFGVDLMDVYPKQIAFCIDHALMRWEDVTSEALLTEADLSRHAPLHTTTNNTYADGRRLQLTKEGKRHFAGVIALFYSPGVQHYLMNMSGGEQEVADLASTRLLGGSQQHHLRQTTGTSSQRLQESPNRLKASAACSFSTKHQDLRK